jgi:flagellar motor component MotA
MEISSLKDVNVKNNAKVSLRSARLALIVVNIIRSLKRDKENFTKSNENKSLLKEFVLFGNNGEKYSDDVKKFMNERTENICGNEKQQKLKELLEEELNKIKEETKKKQTSEKIKESIDVL